MQDNVSALIVVKLQNDFCDGGPCEIPNALTLVPLINKYRDCFNYIIFIKEWHPKYHVCFKINGGIEPTHCVQGTEGAEINQWLTVKEDDYIVHIGTFELYTSDSAFYVAKAIKKESGLVNILNNKSININKIYICGVYTEKFIFSTALDAAIMGYDCSVITDMCIDKDTVKAKQKCDYLEKMGIKLITTKMLISL